MMTPDQGPENFKVRSFKAPPLAGIELPPPPDHIDKFDLEIGAGAGMHAVSYCFANPSRYLVALERTAERYAKFDRRVKRHGVVPNLLHLRADAQWWVAKNLTQGPRLENIFLLYPNPYLKISQQNQRWYKSPFMGFLLDKLVPGGRLTLATNIGEYHAEALSYFTRYWGLRTEARQLPLDLKPRTHFEKKYLEAGQACYEIQAFKPGSI